MQHEITINGQKLQAQIEAVFTDSGQFRGWTITAKNYTESITLYPKHPADENPYAWPIAAEYSPPGNALATDVFRADRPKPETPAQRLQSMNKLAKDTGSFLTFPSGRKAMAQYPVIRPLKRAPQGGESAAARTPDMEIPRRGAPPDFTHNDGFRSVRFRGEPYTFTSNQATVIGAMWEAWESYMPDIADAALLERVETAAFRPRLRDIFKTKAKTHPAWGKVVVPGKRKGTHRLNLPD